MKNYDDIINVEYKHSFEHPPMPRANRAAQFAAFAALKGHDDAVRESSRVTECKTELDEDMRDMLDRNFAVLQSRINEQPEVTVTYFVPDTLKSGGKYVTVDKRLKKIDNIYRKIIMTDGTEIPADDVLMIVGK